MDSLRKPKHSYGGPVVEHAQEDARCSSTTTTATRSCRSPVRRPPFLHAEERARPNANLWREGSYDFWREAAAAAAGEEVMQWLQLQESARTAVAAISSFLRKQRASGAEVSLDMDIETDELRSAQLLTPPLVNPRRPLPPLPALLDTMRSSASTAAIIMPPPPPRREAAAASEAAAQSSNREFRRSPSLARVKSAVEVARPSRAHATPAKANQQHNIKSNDNERGSERTPNKSGMMRRGRPVLGRRHPDEFKRGKIGALTSLQWLSSSSSSRLSCATSRSRSPGRDAVAPHPVEMGALASSSSAGRLVSGWFNPRSSSSSSKRNFLPPQAPWRKAVQNWPWLGLVLLSWHFMFDKRRPSLRDKVLVCSSSPRSSASSDAAPQGARVVVHVSTYFDRIQDALFNQYVVETLSGPPLIEAQQEQYEEDRMMADLQKLQNAGATLPNDLKAATLPNKSGQAAGVGGQGGAVPKNGQIGGIKLSWSGGSKQQQQQQEQQQEDVIRIDQLHKLNQKNISAWNMKRLMKMVRYGTLTTLHEKIPQATGGEDDSTMKIRSEYEAKVAARKIFKNVARPGSK
ncbi:Mechanosensitive ion channel protein 8 [Ananas comosus]|uniref:Mechanosensitive ion channel protein 8 n=1 Tax=Ananas comosus TaxID=4615 RepID=A0A199W3D6_ANACO|nr:Mechanosensitive ion channel protein 8 [Ananas comosus]